MARCLMLTAIPSKLVVELQNNRKVVGYNTLPQIHPIVLETVRSFMVDNVGYSDLPMACLSKSTDVGINPTELGTRLPIKSKDTIIFQIEMPEDMIVSVKFSTLLEISQAVKETYKNQDDFEIEMLREDLLQAMQLGLLEDKVDQISFIPFLAFDKCRMFANIDENFGMSNLTLPGIKRVTLRELTAFID